VSSKRVLKSGTYFPGHRLQRQEHSGLAPCVALDFRGGQKSRPLAQCKVCSALSIFLHDSHHSLGQSSLGVALALAKLCGGTWSNRQPAGRTDALPPWRLGTGSGAWHHRGVPTNTATSPNVSLCSSWLTTIALHLPLTSNTFETGQIYHLAQFVVKHVVVCSYCET
jgi:hypothetical protein